MNRYSVAGVFLVLLANAGCASRTLPSHGGDTHWLVSCAYDEDCGEHTCLCGVCTRRCAEDDACSGEGEAACYDARSPALLSRCEVSGGLGGSGVCLAQCDSAADCGEGQSCMQGACLASTPSDPGAGGTRGPSLRTSDFDDVGSDVSWTEPLILPRPEIEFAGEGLDRILGTWVELGCDPRQPLPPNGPRLEGCLRFEIERDPAGVVTGAVFFDRTNYVLGPFAPATDPDVGYPVEVEPSRYQDLRHMPEPSVPYRLFDGRIQNDRVTFWWSSLDLWHAWCALQTPYPWEHYGHTRHACLPEDPQAQAGIDEGKDLLCRSYELAPLCEQSDGNLAPCPCVTGGGARCTHAYCRCDAEGCDANVYTFHMNAELALDGEQLVGDAFDDYRALVMEREAR